MQITKISANREQNKSYGEYKAKKTPDNLIAMGTNSAAHKNPDTQNFKGIGSAVLEGAGKFFQVCDDVPMIGVAFTDTVATNVPRTVVDFQAAGVPAAAETARREFSGLIVNCLIPGVFVYGAAKATNNIFMKDFKTASGSIVNLSGSWANGESASNLAGIWKDYAGLSVDIKDLTGSAKDAALKRISEKPFSTKHFVKSTLNAVEGLNGTVNWDRLSDHGAIIEEVSNILEPVINKETPKGFIERLKFNKTKNNAIKRAYETIMTGTNSYKDDAGKKIVKVIEDGGGFRASQTLRFNNERIGADLKNLLRDTVDMGSVFANSNDARINPNAFIKKASGLINAKSLIGLAVVIPLAMSMQYINRAITRHKYKKTGAPIYKNFEKEDRILTEKEKKQLRASKPLAVASIVGLAALSMGKTFPKNFKDAAKMLQFNTKFPTLNQCRVIATSTFASRMIASEDPNELRESTVRDLASFAGLYFLGDYAEKLAATGIQKFSKAGRAGTLEMFNRTRDPKSYKGALQKVVGWIKDTSVKSFDEIPKEFKNHRSLAKIGGLGFSIGLLGILLPKYNRHVTNKKEALRKLEMDRIAQHKENVNYQPLEPYKKDSIFARVINKTAENT